MLLLILTKKSLEHFTKKICQKKKKKNQKEFRVEKVIKVKKAINYMLNGKATIVLLIVVFIKRHNINE